MKRFWQTKTLVPIEKYIVVEKEKTLPIPDDPAVDAAIASLKDHAGFQAICRKLSLQSDRLVAALKNERHEVIRDVDFLQSGIFWCNWLSNQVISSSQRVRSFRPATSYEASNFSQVPTDNFELVGALQG